MVTGISRTPSRCPVEIPCIVRASVMLVHRYVVMARAAPCRKVWVGSVSQEFLGIMVENGKDVMTEYRGTTEYRETNQRQRELKCTTSLTNNNGIVGNSTWSVVPTRPRLLGVS